MKRYFNERSGDKVSKFSQSTGKDPKKHDKKISKKITTDPLEEQQVKQKKKKKPRVVDDLDLPSEQSESETPVETQISTQKKKSKTKTVDISDDVQVHDLSQFVAHKFRTTKSKLDKSLKRVHERSSNFSDDLRRKDPYPGDAPIPTEKIERYQRGDTGDFKEMKTKFHSQKHKMKEKQYEEATSQAARTELLLTEQAGFLEADDGEESTAYTQHEIADSVDITSASKFFELKLDKFGPYRINYSRNGRFLLLGGARGHVAAIDWQSKKLMCEMNVMETCSDVKWLHIETMFAVAQKRWTYVYDNQGIELHCLKGMDSVLRLEFLPYHFLLASGNAKGYLQWLDVSIGQKVAGVMTKHGRLDVMCQNPANAVIHCGHSGGTVTLWSPNVKEPLVKMLCHGGGTRSLAVTQDGKYMATSGIDRTLQIWDLRMFRRVHGYKIGVGAGQMAFSQRGLLAASLGNVVEIYKDPCRQVVSERYLTHRLPGTSHGLQFCPYEDVLGAGHAGGFTSLLAPGSGEPNFDALEANPFQTKKQRQQAEVKMLLEKIQPDMISLDTSALGHVDRQTLQEQLEEKHKLLYVKPQKIDFEPRYKKKGRSKAGKHEKRKKGVQVEIQRDHIRQSIKGKQKQARDEQANSTREDKPYDPLNRFK